MNFAVALASKPRLPATGRQGPIIDFFEGLCCQPAGVFSALTGYIGGCAVPQGYPLRTLP